MPMPMCMLLPYLYRLVMCVLMMLIMAVFMLMFQYFMYMDVIVVLCDVQPNAQSH